jgi:flagellar biosynthesis/type III secretory pathway chaperone
MGPASQESVTGQSPSRLGELLGRLRRLLDMEFEALREQALDRFESLQPAKNELLAELAQNAPAADLLQSAPEWADVRDELVACRDLHRRNAVLIERKLEAVRNALQSLTQASQTSSVEVYDRLGQVARFARGRGYQDA